MPIPFEIPPKYELVVNPQWGNVVIYPTISKTQYELDYEEALKYLESEEFKNGRSSIRQ